MQNGAQHRSILTVGFAAVGHTAMHLLVAYYFVVVLALERDWGLPYHELIELWTLGALLVGLCALPAGWIADRWSAPGMLVVMFVGMGLACILCARADGPGSLLIGLSLIGVFAAIYHPVGIPWLVRSTTAKGKALGFNNIFGSLGVAGAGIVAGLLIDNFGWRMSFLVPGVALVVIGVAMATCVAVGLIGDAEHAETEGHRAGRSEVIRVFAILLVTMFAMGFIYNTGQAAFPKVFDLRLKDWVGDGTLGIGVLITVVYGVSAFVQIIGGHLADRYPLKWVYLSSFVIQAPVLAFLATALGLPLVVGATAAVFISTSALPAENLLLARYAPREHQGLVFGLKFVLAFGAAPLAIAFVARIMERGHGLSFVFMTLAALAGVAALAVIGLPSERLRVGVLETADGD